MASRPESQAGNYVPQQPCGICGRTFYPEVLARHQNICEKSAMKKRKVFDSSKMRIRGTDMEQANAESKFRKGRTGVAGPAPKGRGANEGRSGHDEAIAKSSQKKQNWRAKHGEFISAIRNAREVTKAMKDGGPLPPPPPPAENPDYVKCGFCSRRFKPDTAERHIPFCRDKASRLGGGAAPAGGAAKSKLVKRNQYRAPLPGTKRRTSTDGPGGAARPQEEAHPPTGRAGGVQRQTSGPGEQAGVRKPGGTPQRQRPPAGPPTGGARTAAASSGTAMQRTGGMSRATGRPPTGHGQPAAVRRQTSRDSAGPQGSTPQRQASQSRMQSNARTGSLTGMSSTYTVKQYAAQTPPLDLDGPSDQYEQSPSLASLSSNRGSARRRIQEAAEFDRRQYQAEQYTGTIDTLHNRPISSSTSGISDMSQSDISLPPLHQKQNGRAPMRTTQQSAGVTAGMSKFCYNCGTQFPVPHAKYCCECGTKRIMMSDLR